MKLPHAHTAVAPPAKVTEYLLSPTHPVGRYKARAFGKYGFDLDHARDLAATLQGLAARGSANLVASGVFGAKYVVKGVIVSPSGQTMAILSVWIIPAGARDPLLVTAYLDEK